MKNQLSKRLMSILIIAALVFTGTFTSAVPASAEDTVKKQTEAYNMDEQEDAFITEELTELRDEYSKTYEKSDGTSVSIVSGVPLHYYDEEAEKWEEIDNTLKERDGVLINENENFEVTLPKELDKETGITVSNGKNQIIITPVDNSDSTVKVKNNKAKKLSKKKKDQKKYTLDDYAQASLTSSEVNYNNIDESTSLQYILTGNKLKENIILSDKPEEAKTYEYEIKAKGLTATLKKDGSIVFKDKKAKKVFNMPAPYMYDGKEEYSSDIKVSIDEMKGGYILSYSPDFEWLSDEEREYPVYIDPTVTTYTNIEDAYVLTGGVKASFYDRPYLNVGNGSTGRSTIYNNAYIKFKSLPSLRKSSIITKAMFIVKTPVINSNTVNAHEITSSWTESTIDPDNLPNTSSVITDASAPSSAVCAFDITNLADKWYKNSSANNGVMLESPYATTEFSLYSSKNGSLMYNPYLAIEYGSMTPSNYSNSKNIDVGRAGKININYYTGDLRLTREDIGIDGNVMPANIKMIYDVQNINDTVLPGGGVPVYGVGFRTNYHQRIYFTDTSESEGYYTYVNEEGKNVYINAIKEQTLENNVISYKITCTDTDSSGYSFEIAGNSFTDYEKARITDGSGLKYFFDSYGRLVKIADTNLPSIINLINNNSLTATSTEVVNGIIKIKYGMDMSNYLVISKITDGVGRVYEFNGSGSIIYKGADNTPHKTVTYVYDDDYRLTSVTYPDGKSVYYQWSGNNLKKIINTDGLNYVFTYTSDSIPRVSSIKEYAPGETPDDESLGMSINVTYNNFTTTYTDNNSGDKEILQFDKYGNLINSQSADGYSIINNYETSGDSQYITSELVNTFGYQKSSINLLKNSRTQNGTSYWNNSQLETIINNFGKSSFVINETGEITQNVNLAAGKTYALSAYVKTKDVIVDPEHEIYGTSIKAELAANQNADALSINSDAKFIDSTKDWTKISTTFTANQNCQVKICLFLDSISNEAKAYFTGIQLEEGSTVTEFTFVEDADFIENDLWTGNGINSTDAPTINSTKSVFCFSNESTPFDFHCLKLFGDTRYSNSVNQVISNLSGVYGDTYNFGGWAKANAAALNNNKTFGIKVEFFLDSRLVNSETVSFNTYITNWQYNMSAAVAEGTYNKIKLSAIYDYQINYALFDRLQLQYAGVTENESQEDTSEDQNVISSGAEPVSELDSYNRETTYTDTDGVKTLTSYDNYNNITRTATTQTNGAYIEAKNTFTQNGNYHTSETDALGNTVTYNYNDQLGLINQIIDANENEIDYTYDSLDRIKNISQADNESSYIYDKSGRLSHIIRNQIDYEFKYDKFGRQKLITLNNQELINFTYENNLLTEMSYSNGQKLTYQYNLSGKKIGVIHNGILEYSYFYDDFGNLLSERDEINETITSYYQDDEGTQIILVRKGNAILHSYYTEGDSIHEVINTASKETYHTTKEVFDDDPQPLVKWNKTSWKGLNTNKYFCVKDSTDTFGRESLNSIYTATLSDDKQNDSSQTNLVTMSYDYEYKRGGQQQGNRISSVSYSGVYNRRSTDYTYDPNGNITSITYNTHDNNNTVINSEVHNYTYNELGQLSTEQKSGSNIKTYYYYDNGGNITAVVNVSGNMGVPTSLYNYDNEEWTDLLTSFNGNDISYDEIGNPITYYDGTEFEWQNGRQLKSATKTDGKEIKYKYNADGLRTQKIINDTITDYYIRDSKITAQSDGTNTIYFRYDENDNPVGFEINNTNTQYLYVCNPQGDIIAIMKADVNGTQVSCNVVVEYSYDSWGKCTIVSDTSGINLGKLNPFRYRGYYYDEETGFYYLQSRYYDPIIKRFINADNASMASQGVLNLFTYCDNSPLINKDADGNRTYNIKRFNCYAYAMGYTDRWLRPGKGKESVFNWDKNGKITERKGTYLPTLYTVSEMQNWMINDFKNNLRKLSDKNAKIKKGEYRVAIRVAIYSVPTPMGQNPIQIKRTYDFHLWKQNPESGIWWDKPGDQGIRKKAKGTNPDKTDSNWLSQNETLPGEWYTLNSNWQYGLVTNGKNLYWGSSRTQYYNSRTLYLACNRGFWTK